LQAQEILSWSNLLINEDEEISGVVEELSINDTMHQLESFVCFSSHQQEEIVMVNSKCML
jgi:hypothetical protein